MIYVHDARELEKAVNAQYDDCDALVMAAAVSDYRPAVRAENIELTENPDILYGLGQKKTHQFLVGFAAETRDVIEYGKAKLAKKNLNLLVANDVAQQGAGFNVSTNIAALIYKDCHIEQYLKMTKDDLGHIIIEKIAEGIN